MEDGLREFDIMMMFDELDVLILVLMEDGLREVKMQLADLQTFMCEKWPKFQKSHEKKYIFRLQKYNFFRLNNMFFCFFSSKKVKDFL